ncbi:MAG TPA: hypothetical protein PLG20_03685 [Candidatus Syntrophosphaera sp.]|nr:hypothetical protein [Candidatus Syntrophosphaera sp.]
MTGTEFRKIRLNQDPGQHCLFGFLLESMDGLASHSRIAGSDSLEISYSFSREKELLSLLKAWEKYESGGSGALPFRDSEQDWTDLTDANTWSGSENIDA